MAVFSKKAAPATPLVVPTLEDASPEYRSLKAKQIQLEGARSAVERELRDIRNGRMSPEAVARVTGGRGDRAAELLGDLAGEASYTSGPSKADIADHMEKLSLRLGDIDAALAILKERIPVAASAASQVVIDTVRDGYNASLRRLVLTLAPALAAHREVLRIVEGLNDNSIRWSGKLVQPTSLRRVLGDPWDNDTAVHRFIQEVVDAGLVTADELRDASR